MKELRTKEANALALSTCKQGQGEKPVNVEKAILAINTSLHTLRKHPHEEDP